MIDQKFKKTQRGKGQERSSSGKTKRQKNIKKKKKKKKKKKSSKNAQERSLSKLKNAPLIKQRSYDEIQHELLSLQLK